MFQAGEKILYPIYGICTIKAIRNQDILGKSELCYILNIPRVSMEITVPVEKAIKIGIRRLVEQEILEDILNSFNIGDTDPIIFENQRYCKEINKKKIKSGSIHEGSEIIRDLTRKRQRIKLAPDDISMLDNARQVFISELMEVKGLAEEQAIDLLNEALGIENIPSN